LLCKRFEISRRTGYKWLARYRAEGEAGLADRSRRPYRMRQPTSSKTEKTVLALRDAHPMWGARKLRRRLLDQGHKTAPAASTITNILNRHGRIASYDSRPRYDRRFERAEPNELWQMDFKGEIALTSGARCHPLTVLDDHSRYSLVLAACADQCRETVQHELRIAFRRYGLPWAILTDNGPPWGSSVQGPQTQLSVWLMDLDIAVLHGRPYHPQTQGKEERFHRTLKREALQGREFSSNLHVQKTLTPWREVYNHERPHEALGLATPASRYRMSDRSYSDRMAAFEYDASFIVRRVDATGRVVFQNREYFFSSAFAKRDVGVRATESDGLWSVYYRSFRVGQLDETTSRPRR
jgi:transposase InsO family protein